MEKEKLSNLLDCIYELEGLVHLAMARDDNPAGLGKLITGKAAAIAELSAELTGASVPAPVIPVNPVAPADVSAASVLVTAESVPVTAEPEPDEKPEPEDIPAHLPESSDIPVAADIPVTGGMAEPDDDRYEENDEYEEEEDTLYVAPDEDDEEEEDYSTEDITDEEEELILPPIEEALGFRPDPASLKPAEPVRPVRPEVTPRRSVNDEAEGTRRSLNDATARGRLVFSLNDRFRFRRSLFNGDDALFTAALGEVAALENYYEAEDYFYGTLQWQADNQEVVDFMHIIQRYFES